MIKEYKQIAYRDAIDFIIPLHYSGRKPKIQYAFGSFIDGELMAVCSYGIPASPYLCLGIMGMDLKHSVIELNRLCRVDSYTQPLSEFVAWTLRQLKKYNLCVVSYADTSMNHIGTIYQACNFLYTGCSKKQLDPYVPDGKHNRHYYSDNYKHLRLVRQAKHRYIFMAANKTYKNKFLRALKFKVQPYPKGNNQHYVLGTFIKSLVKNQITGELYYE